MNRMVVAVATVVFSCALWATPMTEGAELGEWTMDVPAAQALAKETGKPMFLNFTGSDWCGWCSLMERKVFNTEIWKAYAKENLVLVWLDSPRDLTLVPEAIVPTVNEMKQKYEVKGYPTYVVLDSEGNELGRLGADQSATPASFIRQFKSILAKQNLSELLSFKDFAAYKVADAQLRAFDQRLKAWMEKAQKEANALEAEGEKLKALVQSYLDKAIEKMD